MKNCSSTNSCQVRLHCEDFSTYHNNYLIIPFGTIVIFTAIFGNSLVIISVCKFHRLRQQLTNYFVVSLAFADLLVAVFVMPLNLVQAVQNGRWMFGVVLCAIFNANDVFFSTASLIHIGCIGLDRYIAIMKPLRYERIMTKARIAIILTCSWITSFLISYIPIHSGIYTTKENLAVLKLCPLMCNFKVNMTYSVVSSTISFWIPSFILCVVYSKIYREAKQQELKMSSSLPPTQNYDIDLISQPNDRITKSQSIFSSLSKRNFKREHKAAKTLGIIMGCFIACWLPFFVWYTISNVCQELCLFPEIIVDIVFWIGYINSTLNPIIYAFYNREFRKAFKTLVGYNTCCYQCQSIQVSVRARSDTERGTHSRLSTFGHTKFLCSH